MRYLSPDYVLGLCFICVCASLWAGASVLTQYIYEGLGFSSPFLLTWLANSLLLLYLPLQLVTGGKAADAAAKAAKELTEKGTGTGASSCRDIFRQADLRVVGEQRSPLNESLSNDSDDSGHMHVPFPAETQAEARQLTRDSFFSDSTLDSAAISAALPGAGASPYTQLDIMKVALLIAPVWFIANLFYNYSLLWTSVSSSTIISNLAASFTLLFSWHLNLETVTYCKLLGVAVCFIGAVSVGLQVFYRIQSYTNTHTHISSPIFIIAFYP
jgi:solute carrier family 35 protein F5